MIILYEDDGLVATTDTELATQFFKELGDKLQIKTKVASHYLGLEIARSKDGSIFINQEEVVHEEDFRIFRHVRMQFNLDAYR